MQRGLWTIFEGIHWISVGSRPLIEIIAVGVGVCLKKCRTALRHDVVGPLFHAEPVAEDLELPARAG